MRPSPAVTPDTNAASPKQQVLTIHIHDGGRALRLKLHGQLCSACMRELRLVWESARTVRDQKRLLIEADGIEGPVAPEAAETFGLLDRAGAEFWAHSPADADVIRTVRPDLQVLVLPQRPKGLFQKMIRLLSRRAATCCAGLLHKTKSSP
jgi:hypothetical protein